MAVQNYTLPKPRNDEEWELLCSMVFAKMFGVPDFQRYETRGKNQKGIDLFATLADGRLVVVQCKRRGTKKALTETEAESDYARAKTFKPKPAHFIVATSHDKKGLQEWAAAKKGPTAAVYAWPDFEDILAKDAAMRMAVYGSADEEAIRAGVAEATKPIDATTRATLRVAEEVRTAVVDAPAIEAVKFADDYIHHVSEHLDELDLFGVDLPKEARKYKLSVAYISLNLEVGAGQEESGPRPANAVFERPECRRLLIRGDAGSGKSTLLKWAAIQCVGAEWEYQDGAFRAVGGPHLTARLDDPEDFFGTTTAAGRMLCGYGFAPRADPALADCEMRPNSPEQGLPCWLHTPFLIRLRDCTAGKLPPLAEFARRTADLLTPTPAGWVESVLKAGRGLVLLDGIDEVPPKYREALHKQVRTLIRDYPDNRYVLTTRPLTEGEPDWLKELEFYQARVAPMSRDDREACIDRWHAAVQEELDRVDRQDPKLAGLPAKLKTALSDAHEIARLATNPLLCAMICALHRNQNHLPDSLNELLEALSMILLFSRERQTPEFEFKEFDQRYAGLSYEDRKAIVSHLAKYMVEQGESSLPRSMVEKKIGEALTPLRDRSVADAPVVLRGLLERSGMLREKTPTSIDFIHNTFKEYLAAVRFLDAELDGPLAEHAHEAGWDNVAVFAAAAAVRNQDFSDRLVSKMLPPEAAKRSASPRRRGRYTKVTDVEGEDAKRYKRAVTAVRVVAAIRTKLKPETARRFEALRKSLFPPRSLSDAAGLATAGNAVLKFVRWSAKLAPAKQVRCVRTLRLIETPEARELLKEFMGTHEVAILEELAQAVDPLLIPAVLECFAITSASLARAERRESAYQSWRDEVRDALCVAIRSVDAVLNRTDITELLLDSTAVGDVAMASLALTKAGLKSLMALHVAGTQITDAGVAALSSPATGLKDLAMLDLGFTRVTDAAAASLGSEKTGLKSLTALHVARTQISDAGVAALCASKTGLKSLTTLTLHGTAVTDKGLSVLCSPNTGLKSLTTLNLGHTGVTDAGLSALCAPDTGLKYLTTLSLSRTAVTDKGMSALCSPDTGLKSLTTLILARAAVTDKGVSTLCAPDTGLKSLAKLNLGDLVVTDAALASLASPETGLKGIRQLHFWGTKVTNAGIAALCASNTGLSALKTVYLGRTAVTNTGVAMLRTRWPGIEVIR